MKSNETDETTTKNVLPIELDYGKTDANDGNSVTSKTSQRTNTTTGSKETRKSGGNIPKKKTSTIASMFKTMQGKSAGASTTPTDRALKIAHSRGAEKQQMETDNEIAVLELLEYTKNVRHNHQTTQQGSGSPKARVPADQK